MELVGRVVAVVETHGQPLKRNHHRSSEARKPDAGNESTPAKSTSTYLPEVNVPQSRLPPGQPSQRRRSLPKTARSRSACLLGLRGMGLHQQIQRRHVYGGQRRRNRRQAQSALRALPSRRGAGRCQTTQHSDGLLGHPGSRGRGRPSAQIVKRV
jgi:hypothetical protein